MLRTIPRHLRNHLTISGPWLQRVCRVMSSVTNFSEGYNQQGGRGSDQSSSSNSRRLTNSALFTAVLLGAAAYHWRHSPVSHCASRVQPIIYVDWSPPTSKSKKRVSSLSEDDKGDSKSVHKSEMSGVELEEISNPTVVTHPHSTVTVQSTAQTSPASKSSSTTSSHSSLLPAAEKPPIALPASDTSIEDEIVVKDSEGTAYIQPSFIDEAAVGIPEEVPYVIVGSGTAAMAAARAIRGSDTTARVLIIGDEPHSPYMRPPLSKELWRRSRERQTSMLSGSGNMKRHSWMFFESDNFFIPPDHLNAARYGGIALWKKKKVVGLNIEERYVELESGERVRFQKCLLATGGRPRQLPSLTTASEADPRVADRVLYFRNIADFEKMREVATAGGRIVIVGGGFLGSELAVSLAELASKQEPKKLEVVQVFRDSEGNMSHVLPSYLAEHTMKFMSDKGVKIVTSDEVIGATWDADQSKVTVNFQKNETITADYIVVTVGLEANTQLATDSGLEVDPVRGGFLVNAELEARNGVYAAGDASSYYDLLLGRRRVEHINHAEESGRIAGRNMAGDHAPYHHQSSFWSTLGREISWDAIGLIDAKLETQGFFAMPPGEEGKMDFSYPGIVFYLKGRKLVGILLWNLPDDIYTDEKRFAPSRLNLVRKVLEDRRFYTYDDLAQLARDFDLYETIAEDYEDLKEFMLAKSAERDAPEKKG